MLCFSNPTPCYWLYPSASAHNGRLSLSSSLLFSFISQIHSLFYSIRSKSHEEEEEDIAYIFLSPPPSSSAVISYFFLYNNALTTTQQAALLLPLPLPCHNLSPTLNSFCPSAGDMVLPSLRAQRGPHHLRKPRHNRRILDERLRGPGALPLLRDHQQRGFWFV